MQKNSSVLYIFLICTWSQTEVLEFQSCHIKFRVKVQINLQLTGKISLKLNSNSN